MRMLSTGTALALALMVAGPALAKPGDPGRERVVAAIKADHEASIERLRQWIALPTIANMNINHREGAEYMRQLVLDAGFQQAKIIDTDGVPGRDAAPGRHQRVALRRGRMAAAFAPNFLQRGLARAGAGHQLVPEAVRQRLHELDRNVRLLVHERPELP